MKRNRLEELGMTYGEYLASREWALKKEAVRERSGGWCERCLAADYESTHHVTYQNIGNEPLDDLLAVCNPCHKYISGKTDVDPIKGLVPWIIVGPKRPTDRGFQSFMDGISQGYSRIVGGITPDGKPRYIVDISRMLTQVESAGTSAGLVA